MREVSLTRNRATIIGCCSILLWSLFALLTVGTAPTPPLLLNAVCFAVGGTAGLVWTVSSGRFSRLLHVKWQVYAFGTAGLFGFHFFYVSALRIAPPAQAGLINYLWPLLILLLSGLLPGERLRAGQIAGAMIAFAGVALILLGGDDATGTANAQDTLAGYALAAAGAVTWAVYSVGSRWIGEAPTETVAVFCLAAGLLSLAGHLTLETPAWPATTGGWLAMAVLGLGPMGMAFYTWDIGMKQGDIQMLGTASYAAPLLSTLALILAGFTQPSATILIAAGLIAGGAALAARAGRRERVSGKDARSLP